MGLPWIRLDTTLASNPKVLELVDDKKHRAVMAYILGLTYSGGHGLDGFIPRAALPFIHATAADAKSLVSVGMWTARAGGWDINGWTEFQVSDEEARKRRQRAQAAAAKRWSAEKAGETDAS